MDQQSILALEKNNLLKNADIKKLNLGDRIGKIKTINGGEVLYREGESANSVYMVLNGEINLLKKNKSGESHSVVFSDDDFFGAKELFTNIDRCTTTVSLTDSYLIELTKDEIEFLVEQDEHIALNVQKGNKDFHYDEELIDVIHDKYIGNFDDYETEESVLGEFITESEISDIMNSIENQEKAIFDNFQEFDDDLNNFEYLNSQEIIDNYNKNHYTYFEKENNNIHEKNMNEETVQKEKSYMSAEQFEMILKALQLVNSNVKKDDALSNIVDVAINLTNADRGTLYLVDGDEIWSKVLAGEESKEIRLKVGTGIAGWVAESGEILNIKDVTQDERFDASFDKASGYTTKNMLVYPIKNKNDETVGVLQLINSLKGDFTELEESFLNAISLNVAVALENTSLVEKLLTTERDMSIGKMGNFLTHDLKKPILTCLRYAEHLTKKELTFEAKQVANLLVEQLKQVSNQLVSASGFTEGTTLLRRQQISINDLLQEFAINVHGLIKTNNCKIEHELNDDVTINVDKKEMYQCYQNIIKNACEALPEGGNIFISTIKQDDNIEIYFVDKGVGIEGSDLKFVFDPLWTKNKKNSSGLGLSISKKIVEDHEGTISIKSEKDSGTTVIISLPIH